MALPVIISIIFIRRKIKRLQNHFSDRDRKVIFKSCVLICFLLKAESPCEQQTKILVKESIEEEGSLRKKFGVTKKKFPFYPFHLQFHSSCKNFYCASAILRPALVQMNAQYVA